MRRWEGPGGSDTGAEGLGEGREWMEGGIRKKRIYSVDAVIPITNVKLSMTFCFQNPLASSFHKLQ